MPQMDDSFVKKAIKQKKVTIHVVRHAQAEHNVRQSPDNGNMVNPALTPHGIKQCARLRAQFPYMDKINIVLCSPLTRTLETALHGFTPLFQRGLAAVLWAELVEWGDCPCNDYGTWNDFSAAVPDLNKTLAPMRYERDLVQESNMRDRVSRVELVKRELYILGQAMQKNEGIWYDVPVGKLAEEDEEIHILIISHGGFLKSLDEHSSMTQPPSLQSQVANHRPTQKESFSNTQYRSYEFPTIEAMLLNRLAPFDLVETQQSNETVFVRLLQSRKEIHPFSDKMLTIEEQMAELPQYAFDPTK